jgi:putative addiction module killer protein
MTKEFEVVAFSKHGKEPFTDWLRSFNINIRNRIISRIDRIIEYGNFGDFKNIGNGILELRITFGSGYRIYFGKDGNKLIILLCGGDKKTQKFDIEKAKKYWKEYKSLNN